MSIYPVTKTILQRDKILESVIQIDHKQLFLARAHGSNDVLVYSYYTVIGCRSDHKWKWTDIRYSKTTSCHLTYCKNNIEHLNQLIYREL